MICTKDLTPWLIANWVVRPRPDAMVEVFSRTDDTAFICTPEALGAMLATVTAWRSEE